MMKQFVAIHYPMSMEDPERDFPAEAFAVSDDLERLIQACQLHLAKCNEDDNQGFEQIQVVEGFEQTLIKASFSDGEFLTYFVIALVKTI